MPTEEDDDDHDVVATTSLPASTTTLPADATATHTKPLTTGQPDRPVNTKPTETPGSTSEAEESQTSTPSTWLPSFLPTFGVSASTQIWIYGALVLIVVFCCGLGVYFWMARRKRLRNGTRDDYEFELLDEEEAEGLNGGEKRAGAGAGGKRGRRTRGGELYDAFAGGSDEEDEDDLDVVGGYRDGDRDRSDDGSNQQLSEKRALRDDDGGSDEEEHQHHVVGDDDDEDEDDDDDDRGRGNDAVPLTGARQ